MIRKFLILASVISLAILAGCDASVCVGGSDGIACQVDNIDTLDPSEGITVNGTLSKSVSTGTSANIAKSLDTSKAGGISKAFEDGGLCYAKLADGTVIGTNSLDNAGSFTLLLDPSQLDTYKLVFVWCYPVVNGAVANVADMELITLGSNVAGDAITTNVDINTTLSVLDLFNGADTDPSNPTPFVNMLAAGYPINQLHDTALQLAQMVESDIAAGLESSGSTAAYRTKRDFFYDLAATSVAPTLGFSDMRALIQGNATTLQTVAPYLSASFIMANVQAALDSSLSYNIVVREFYSDASIIALYETDHGAMATGIAQYLGNFDPVAIGTLRGNVTGKIGSVRDMFKEYANTYVATGDINDLPTDKLALQTLGHALTACDASDVSGKYDVLKTYAGAIGGSTDVVAAAAAASDQTAWTSSMGSGLCNVAKLTTTDTKTSIEGQAATLLKQLANNPSDGVGDSGKAILDGRLAAYAQGGSYTKTADSCSSDSDCSGGKACSLGIRLCVTACQSACLVGDPCNIDSNCKSNYCLTGSCALNSTVTNKFATLKFGDEACTTNAQCYSGNCSDTGVCVEPNFQAPGAVTSCQSYNTCTVTGYATDRKLCLNNVCSVCTTNDQCVSQMGTGWTCTGEALLKRCTPPVTPPPPVAPPPQCNSYLDCKIVAPGNLNYNLCNSGSCVACTLNVECVNQMGIGWACLAGECAPPPPPPPPSLSGTWDRTTAPPNSSVNNNCPVHLNADNLTIGTNGANYILSVNPSPPNLPVNIIWNGLGQNCTADICGGVPGCLACTSCSVTNGTGATGTVFAASGCDLPGPPANCAFSYTKE